jgi:hypothetical protein
MMYCITIRIAEHRHDEWLTWMRDVHVPDVLATQCFRAAWLMKPEGGSLGDYRVYYDATDAATFAVYQRDFAPTLQVDHSERFAGDFAASREILGVIARYPA